jgi:hypothetical protein
MKTFAMRVAVLAIVVSLSSLGNEANAGCWHLRIFRSGCGGACCSGCSCGGGVPAYVSAPIMTSAWQSLEWQSLKHPTRLVGPGLRRLCTGGELWSQLRHRSRVRSGWSRKAIPIG